MTPTRETIDAMDRLFDPLGRCFTPEVARSVASLRADRSVQARIDELADKSTEGRLSSQELEEYETYVWAINFISVLQAKARTVLSRGEVK